MARAVCWLDPGARLGGRRIVAIDTRYYRPSEVDTLLGNAAKARKQLGWSPKISFDEMISEMMEADMRLAEKDALTRKHGFKTFDYNE